MSISFRACFQATFCTDFRLELWTPGFLKRGFLMGHIVKTFCRIDLFHRFQVRFLLFFEVSDIRCPEDRLENCDGVSVV